VAYPDGCVAGPKVRITIVQTNCAGQTRETVFTASPAFETTGESVPRVVRDAVARAAIGRDIFALIKPTHEMADMNVDTARQLRAWLEALPPLPAEGR